jgi:hypothetical protein
MKTAFALVRILAGLGVLAVLGGCGGGGGERYDPFNFRTDAPERFVRVDRAGEPAIATALLSRAVGNPAPVDGSGTPVNPGAGNPFNGFDDQRDAFNRGDPIDDARDFAFMLTRGPQVNALASYHYELGPQLRFLGLTPCSTEMASPPSGVSQVDISICVAQVAPVVLPDVISSDPETVAGWPNGRGYAAQYQHAGWHHQSDQGRDRHTVAGRVPLSATGARLPLIANGDRPRFPKAGSVPFLPASPGSCIAAPAPVSARG